MVPAILPLCDTHLDRTYVYKEIAVSASSPISTLFGALCIAEQLITPLQLETCLKRQARDLHELPVGQILVQLGYLSDTDRSRILVKQRTFREALLSNVEQLNTAPLSPSASHPYMPLTQLSLVPEIECFTDSTESWLFEL